MKNYTQSRSTVGLHHWLRLLMAVASLAFVAAPVYGLDDSRLWLPTKYRVHYIKLKEAALTAENLVECAEVLRGTLDLDLSRAGQPYFRILCRRPDATTYSEIVDGLTMEPRSQREAVPPPESPRERELRLANAERERLAEEERVRALAEQERVAAEEAQKLAEQEAEELALRREREQARRKALFEEVCYSEILARTNQMISLRWITDRPIAEELENGQMRFHTEFDAENLWGKPLHYKAVCTISTPSELVVVVSPR